MSGCIAIIGAGQAGLQLALSLRTLGYGGRVVLLGDEPGLPYQRPPLSKGFLAGQETLEDLELRDPSIFEEERIELIAGKRVDAVKVGDERGELTLDDGATLAFDTLALATGSTARRLPIPGADLDGVLTLRDVADAERLCAELEAARDVVVIGGGFIGLEIAATARAQGKTVTVIEAAARILARVVAEPVSAHVSDWHRAQGTTVLINAGVTELTGTDRVTGVVLADGTSIDADVVVTGVGAAPSVALAQSLDLPVERGIVTDESGRTSHPRVFAVGDCTVQPHPTVPGRLIGIESVNNAVEQATAAASAILGHEPAPRGVPWFWSNQGELKLQMAGISDGHDHHVVRGDGSDGRLSVLYYRGDRLIAADVVNNPRDFNAVRNALAKGATIDPEAATDVEVALKSLVR
ncbi:NAD(P)/FAD-dependent oxidoreductase [Nocardioides sp. NPDC101246]|uniref:NAD(P)/FAD-dependent oxidoreductase n=1 Tax=Nocardioides sp. NPDC101246 TaxID=3364336 RepID=UPI0038300C28